MLIKHIKNYLRQICTFTAAACLVTTAGLQVVVAQETTAPVIKDVAGLRLQLVGHTQDPVTQEVEYEVIVFSQIDSDRVQVTWTVSGSGKLVSDVTQTIPMIAKDNVYHVTGRILPQAQGTIDLLVKVEAFAADGVRLSTARQAIGVYPSKEVFPITSNYRLAQAALVIRALALVGIALILGFFLLKFGYDKFRKWRDKDDLGKLPQE